MAPKVVGQYVLERRIATGGMAEVWLASAPDGSKVVVKSVLPHLATNPASSQMLLHEARVAMQLEHPNIVRVFEVTSVDGVPCIVMEHVDGVDLGALLKRVASRRTRVPLPVALELGVEVSEALHFAHQACDRSGAPLQIVHRDVSANNVMLTTGGQAKLLDFGIVKVGDTQLTEPGMIKGKFAFMSPEQAAGTPLDGRSDLFALALMIYEMVSGVRPYRRETEPGTYHAALLGQVAPLSSAWPDAPPALEAVLSRALQFDRNERYQSLAEFAEALKGTGAVADQASVARWAAGLTEGALAPELDATPYLAEKSLDPEGQLFAPVRQVTAADFDAPDQGALELSRKVAARSSVQLPDSSGRPSMVLQPVTKLDLPPERRSPRPPPAPVVLPTLGATPVVAAGKGVPVKTALVVVMGVLAVGLLIWVATRRADPPPVVSAPPPPPAVAAVAFELDAGDDLDPSTGMRRTLGAVIIGDPDHLAREHPELEPVRYFIDSVPSGATLTVNGEVVGKTPWGGDNDPLRGATVTVTLRGYRPWSVTIDAGVDFATTIKLRR